MKVLFISFMEAKIDREQLTREILNSARGEGINLVVIPGNVKREYRIRKDQSWASTIADEFRLGILHETLPTKKLTDNYYSFYLNSLNTQTSLQMFATASQADKNKNWYKLLIREINAGKRTMEIEGVNIGILICGENNILKNKQSNFNKAGWRHSKPKKWKADIIINPSHNTMGNWDKLNKRFKFFSKKYGYSAYLTNSSRLAFGKSSLRIYKKGKEIKNGQSPDFITQDKNAIGCILEI